MTPQWRLGKRGDSNTTGEAQAQRGWGRQGGFQCQGFAEDRAPSDTTQLLSSQSLRAALPRDGRRSIRDWLPSKWREALVQQSPRSQEEGFSFSRVTTNIVTFLSPNISACPGADPGFMQHEAYTIWGSYLRRRRQESFTSANLQKHVESTWPGSPRDWGGACTTRGGGSNLVSWQSSASAPCSNILMLAGGRGRGGIAKYKLFSLPDVTICIFPNCISFYSFLTKVSSLFGLLSISSFGLGFVAAPWEIFRGILTMGVTQEHGIS